MRKKILVAAVALAAAVAVFFAGYFVYYLSLPSEVRSLLWVKDKIQSEYYKDIDDDTFWDAVFDGAVSALDKYSAYYTADEYDVVVDSSRGISQGLGLSFFSGTNTVAKAAYNSPAFYAGLETGMFITGAGRSETEIEDTFTAVAGTDGKVQYSYAALGTVLGKFAVGDTAYLRVSTVSGHEKQDCRVVAVTLARFTESYVLYAESGAAYILAYDNGGNSNWTDVSEYVSVDEKVAGDTAYIRLTSFYGNAAEEFGRAALAYKQGGKGKLLFDLRNDGGGSVQVMQGIAAYLMKDAKSDSDPVMRAVYGNGREEIYLAGGDYYDEYFAGSDIFVAANRNTASASEALMGVMLSYNTVEYSDIFITDLYYESETPHESRTYGKGIMQTTFTNASGEAIKLTTATIHWPDEASTCIHDTGISTADGARPTQGAKSFGDYGDAELSWMLSQIAG